MRNLPRRVWIFCLMVVLSLLYWTGVGLWIRNIESALEHQGANELVMRLEKLSAVGPATEFWLIGLVLAHVGGLITAAVRKDRELGLGVAMSLTTHVLFIAVMWLVGP